jgi:hypothetical protein
MDIDPFTRLFCSHFSELTAAQDGVLFFWTASYHPTNKLNGQTNGFWGSPTLRKPTAKVMAKKLSLNFQERGPWGRSPKWLMQKNVAGIYLHWKHCTKQIPYCLMLFAYWKHVK